jgi:hypothetical protein
MFDLVDGIKIFSSWKRVNNMKAIPIASNRDHAFFTWSCVFPFQGVVRSPVIR